MWSLAMREFLHSHVAYDALEDAQVLPAYAFLLRIRAFVHRRRSGRGGRMAGADHPEDVLESDDFLSFGEMLGSGARERDRFEFADEERARFRARDRMIKRALSDPG